MQIQTNHMPNHMDGVQTFSTVPMLALKDRKSFIKAIRTAKRVASGKRAAAACAGCKKSRVKCDDTRPCKRCRALKLCSDCKFDSQVTVSVPGESPSSVCIRNVNAYCKLESRPEIDYKAPILQESARANSEASEGNIYGNADDVSCLSSSYFQTGYHPYAPIKQENSFSAQPLLPSMQGSSGLILIPRINHFCLPWRNAPISISAPLFIQQQPILPSFSFELQQQQSQAMAALFLERLLG